MRNLFDCIKLSLLLLFYHQILLHDNLISLPLLSVQRLINDLLNHSLCVALWELVEFFRYREAEDLKSVDVVIHLENLVEIFAWLQDFIHVCFYPLLLNEKQEGFMHVLLEDISGCCVELSVSLNL